MDPHPPSSVIILSWSFSGSDSFDVMVKFGVSIYNLHHKESLAAALQYYGRTLRPSFRSDPNLETKLVAVAL